MLPNRRTFLRTAIGSIAGLSLPHLVPVRALTQAPSGRITAMPVADNIFLLTGAGANVIAMTGEDGVVMVDGGLAEHVPALLQAVSGLPRSGRIHTLFNTCWFPEQTGANETLGKTGATIIAHENTRLWMTTDITRPWEKRTFLPAPKEARPNKTFYDKGTLAAGSESIEYGYMLQAHTDGDLYVLFSKSNVLAVGGVISGEGWPFIDWWNSSPIL